MSDTTLKTRIQIRRGTIAQWDNNTLKKGEFGLQDTDTLKIGTVDGQDYSDALQIATTNKGNTFTATGNIFNERTDFTKGIGLGTGTGFGVLSADSTNVTYNSNKLAFDNKVIKNTGDIMTGELKFKNSIGHVSLTVSSEGFKYSDETLVDFPKYVLYNLPEVTFSMPPQTLATENYVNGKVTNVLNDYAKLDAKNIFTDNNSFAGITITNPDEGLTIQQYGHEDHYVSFDYASISIYNGTITRKLEIPFENSTLATEEYVDNLVSGVFKYMGTCTYANLPTGAVQGDVWNVTDAHTEGSAVYPAGTNYAWSGDAWDPLGGDIATYATKTWVQNSANAKSANYATSAGSAGTASYATTASGNKVGNNFIVSADEANSKFTAYSWDGIVVYDINDGTIGKSYNLKFPKESSATLATQSYADNAYTLPLSTSTVRGGIKTGYTENGKNYAVKLSGEKAYVNVPWTDNNTTYTADKGIKLTGTTFGHSNIYTVTTEGFRKLATDLYGHVKSTTPVTAEDIEGIVTIIDGGDLANA